MKTTVKGAVCGALAAVCYGLNPLFALPLYERGMRPDSVLLFCYFFALLLLGVPMAALGKSFRLRKKLFLPALGCGLLMGGSSLLFFLAYSRMDPGTAATLFFIYPVFVASAMCLFFRERLAFSAVLGITGVLGGIFLLRTGGGPLNPPGVICSLGAALCYAFYMIAARESPAQELAPETLTFYSMIFSMPVFLAAAAAGGGVQKIPTLSAAVLLTGLALFSVVFPFLLLTAAVRWAGPTRIAVLGALEPLTAWLIGIFVFGGILTLRGVCGILLILLSVLLVIAGDARARGETEKNRFHS